MKYTCIALLFLLVGCHSRNQYPYAIKDFSQTLQPYLIRIVSTNIVGHSNDEEFIRNNTTDKELIKLSKAENPMLRATALRIILERSSFDHYDVIMHNLSDTAWVWADWGEWGIQPKRVTDDMLDNARWKDSVAKNKTVEEVITNHNYLGAAYSIINRTKPYEKYYPFIKEMASREPGNIFLGEPTFEQLEHALYALAKYKKREDTYLIRDVLLNHISEITTNAFDLMEKYPDNNYLAVYEKFYPKSFYRSICREYHMDVSEAFINSVASYKNVRSARILDVILNRKPFMPCSADTEYLKKELMYAIWNNNCTAYSALIKQVQPSIKKYEAEQKKYPDLPLDNPTSSNRDTSLEKIWWYE
jgi:hypothetical protein